MTHQYQTIGMPNCKKCEKYFPTINMIEGKKRNLGNRKYCLSCSPFGGRNTRQLHMIETAVYEKLKTRQIKCAVCDRIYEYHHADSKGHTTTKCNSCLVNLQRFGFKQKCVEYKGNKCELCGYSKCLRALSFHHKDKTKKDFGISGKHCMKWDKIKTELDKCILLCSNCHMEEHERLEKCV